MKGATLLLGQREREALHRLRDQATKAPVNITGLEERIDAPGGKAAYTRQVSAQTVMIRMDFLVTFGSKPATRRVQPALGHVCET